MIDVIFQQVLLLPMDTALFNSEGKWPCAVRSPEMTE